MKSVVLVGLSSDQHPSELNKDPNNLRYVGNASWAAMSHYPALQQLKKKFLLRGLLNSTEASGKRIAKLLENSDPNLKVYCSEDEIAQDSNKIDMVIISVGVRHHCRIIMKLINSPLLIYSEWPLATSLEESEKILAPRKDDAKTTIVGLQARKAPQILMAKSIIESGALGSILRTRALGYCGDMWNGQILEDSPDYYLNSENGQTLFTIPFAHLFDAIIYTLGSYPVRLSSEILNRYPEYSVVNKQGTSTGKVKRNDCPNDILVSGMLENNVTISVNAIPGLPVDKETPGLKWEIFGTEGYIVIESRSCFVEMNKLNLKHFDKNGKVIVSNMDDYNPFTQNIVEMYKAIELHQEEAQRFAFSGVPTFKDAVVLHRILNRLTLSSNEAEVVNFTEDDFYKF